MDSAPELRRDAESCALAAFEGDAQVQDVSLREFRIDWDHDGYVGFATNVTLRSGIELCISQGQAKRLVRIPFDGPIDELMFTLSRGTGITYAIEGAPPFLIGGGMLEITRGSRPVIIESTLAPGAHNEFVVLSLTEQLMCDLLSIARVPDVVQGVLASDQPYARAYLPMNVELFRLLDELQHCATAGKVRELYLEAKGLEVLARVFEKLESAPNPNAATFHAADVARLHRARDCLVAQMTTPPSVEALARHVGLNCTKLKAEFRSFFGVPVYAYLRDHRMSEAYRLLLDGDHTVTEVAMTVGYANPSKFAAAFRKQFGLAPTEVRSAFKQAL